MKSSNNKHQINLYTYYTFPKGQKKKYASENNERIQIVKHIERSINKPLKNSNFKFKIHYQWIDSSEVNYDSIFNFQEKNNIHIASVVPNGFKEFKDSELKDKFFANRIHFDNRNALNNATMGFVQHSNLFHTPAATTLIDTYNKHFQFIFEGRTQTKLLYFDCEENKTSRELVNKIITENEKKGWKCIAVYDWKKNNFENLKLAFKSLDEADVILLDKTCWFDRSGNPVSSDDYVEGREQVFSNFIQNECKADLVGFRLTPSKIEKLFNNVDHIENDIVYNYVGDEKVEKLEVQDFLLNFMSKVTSRHKQFLSIFADNLWLIGYLFRKDDYTYTNREDFIEEARKRLISLDGINDSFLKFSNIVFFDENQMSIAKTNPLIQITSSGFTTNQRFYNKQASRDETGFTGVNVSYKNFDFLTLDHVSIEDNQFDISFNLELTTPFENGIDILQFNNLVQGSMESKMLSKKKLPNGYYYFRYYVDGTFYFLPKAENYPFDTQKIHISYALSGQKYGILEPITSYHDNKIVSDGWNVTGFRSGIIRRKEEYAPIFEESFTLVSEQHRVEILISRPNSFTVTKVLIPLAFLAGLTVWATYLSIDDVGTIIGSVTTAFLSAIALYFSVEKPKPLSMTTTDLIFLLFYLFVGITSLSIFVFIQFFQDYYYSGMMYTRWGLGVFTAYSFYYLYSRVKSLK